MPKIYVNFKHNKKDDSYKILNYGHVFVDMPIAVMDLDVDIEEPLVVPIRNVLTVVEKSEYLKVHKKFLLKFDNNGKVYESPDGYPVYLPKDTDVSKLQYIDGQLVMVDDSEAQIEEIVEDSDGPKYPQGNVEEGRAE